ncbi:hypothetical protein MNEG_1464 [Monoraphidium neglectum]|uniref:Uncharacterized protein n=1 Tax=Monoraphidium neglectum TaxID=145388 RepID=A0A0D2K8D4_9CHLO|nr:hypothetical protein MNEG_1464 [Monoraphidium neglectum]KIZ06483.1 hypothetical protein MNEG_1464 [Monoraphidium neglectum]|eukprot:XP_013905502.1 hypothetical protein MNEG_1464 [Monoraphidium neglectum]
MSYRGRSDFSEGVNSQGNYYQHRGEGAAPGGSYYYSNNNGSYYYQNPNGSTYHGLGEGRGGVYTAPGQTQGEYRAPSAPKSGK